MPVKVKRKVYRTVVRQALMYWLETTGLSRKQEAEMEVAELKMLRFSLGVTREDRIENRYIRGSTHVRRMKDKLREGRLRWYEHVRRRDEDYVGRRVMEMDVPGTRRRGRPKRRYMDSIKEDLREVGARVEDVTDRRRWRELIRCGDPWREMPKEEEEVV